MCTSGYSEEAAASLLASHPIGVEVRIIGLMFCLLDRPRSFPKEKLAATGASLLTETKGIECLECQISRCFGARSTSRHYPSHTKRPFRLFLDDATIYNSPLITARSPSNQIICAVQYLIFHSSSTLTTSHWYIDPLVNFLPVGSMPLPAGQC